MNIRGKKAAQYLLAAGMVALAWMLRFPIYYLSYDWVPHSLFFPVVACAVLYGGVDVGIFAAILASGGLVIDVVGGWDLKSGSSEQYIEWVDGLLFAAVNFLIVALAEGMTRARQRAEQLAEERRLHLETEQQLRTEAEQANLAKDEFLASVSHELRSPLQPIIGWSQLLMQQDNLPTDTKNALATIFRSAEMQSHLVEDLLDMSRIVTGHMRLDPQPVELSAVVQEAIDTVSIAAAAKQITIDIDIATGNASVRADHARLVQVLWNLLSNAVKFTPAGGAIHVACRHRQEFAEIAVSDNGQGIPPDLLPQVFERFQKGDPSGQRRAGLGLGLAIVKNIVELHGGTVTADSPGPGAGSTFTIRLPASPVTTTTQPRPAVAVATV